MNGLKEFRNSVQAEETAKRFQQIDDKLDAILMALTGPKVGTTEKKVTTGPSGEVVSTQTVTTTAVPTASVKK
jgi:hypothetical protein